MGVFSVAYGAGVVWAVNGLAGTVVRIDPASCMTATSRSVGRTQRAFRRAAEKLGIEVVRYAGCASGSSQLLDGTRVERVVDVPAALLR